MKIYLDSVYQPESSDYSEWRKDLWEDLPVEEIALRAMDFVKNHFGEGNMIEKFPFFKGYHSKGNAIVDIALLEEWLDQRFEIMSDKDEADRKTAYEELEKGEALEILETLRNSVIKYDDTTDPLELKQSADLYAEIYEKDTELQELTESAVEGWPE